MNDPKLEAALHDPAALAAATVRELILARPLTYTTEGDLQEAVDELLAHAAAGTDPLRRPNPIVDVMREVRIDPHNRIDFVVCVSTGPGTEVAVGVEVKIDGALAAVTRQLDRYAQCADIDELLLVTTRAKHHPIPTTLHGKPVLLCSLIGAAL